MDNVKSLFASRTFWSAFLGLVASIAGAFNFGTIAGIAADPAMVDKALFVVGSISSIGAIFFRAKATAVIGAPS